jgi:hypothetical protein
VDAARLAIRFAAGLTLAPSHDAFSALDSPRRRTFARPDPSTRRPDRPGDRLLYYRLGARGHRRPGRDRQTGPDPLCRDRALPGSPISSRYRMRDEFLVDILITVSLTAAMLFLMLILPFNPCSHGPVGRLFSPDRPQAGGYNSSQ